VCFVAPPTAPLAKRVPIPRRSHFTGAASGSSFFEQPETPGGEQAHPFGELAEAAAAIATLADAAVEETGEADVKAAGVKAEEAAVLKRRLAEVEEEERELRLRATAKRARAEAPGGLEA